MEQYDIDDGQPQIVVTIEYTDPTTGKKAFISRAVDKADYDSNKGILLDEVQSMAEEFNNTIDEAKL
ncbi:hypothetical protein [Raoultella sp. C349492]|uniref:hypothetical protein n=1 Tax=Raoultella sp. C349492 TaxID=2970253 RepID=UPI0035C6BB15